VGGTSAGSLLFGVDGLVPRFILQIEDRYEVERDSSPFSEPESRFPILEA